MDDPIPIDGGKPHKPRRCRGVPLGGGHFTGCAFGDGGAQPFEPPVDCPICKGSGIEPKDEPGPVPFDPAGWNFFCEECDAFREARRMDARDAINDSLYHEFVCNTCHSILLTFQQPTPDVKPAPDVASAMCPHCGSVNLFPRDYHCRRVRVPTVRRIRSGTGARLNLV
jgi:hypothetical protein